MHSIPALAASHSITKNAPYACGNFHACTFIRFQKPQHLGRAPTACLSIVTSCAQRARPNLSGQRCCKLWLKHWQRRLENCSSSSSLHRGWSVRMATRWSSHRPACFIRYRSPHVSSSVNDSFTKFRGPAHVALTIHTFRTVERTAGRRFVREEVRIHNCEVWKAFVCQYAPPRSCAAGVLRKPNVACLHPDVSTGWPVMWSAPSSHSTDYLSSTERIFFFAFAPISLLKA